MVARKMQDWQIEQLPIFCYYDRQRFTQFGSMDCANWYGIAVDSGKKKQALYPAMGRQHVRLLNQNKLVFNAQPRVEFKSINFLYVVDGTTVYQFDRFYNRKTLSISVALGAPIWFATLAVGTTVYNMMTDNNNIFVITENGSSVSAEVVTDPNAPGGSTTGGKPLYVAAFGNRFVVSLADTPDFYLSQINLSGNANTYFTDPSLAAALNARASGVIGQFAVLHNQLYIMCDFTTDVWANIITQITVGGVTREFPWKLNSSYNFDFGIADPNSLSVDFGMMVWLAKNSNGLVSFMISNGQKPEDISSQAINVLLENSTHPEALSPFLLTEVDGFLYQYENTIFYRAGAGTFVGFGDLDIIDNANCIEYNFETKKWGRAIELNGERNRIQKHVYFNNAHLVIVQGDPAIYQMAGNIYHNELRNPDQPDAQADDAFLKYPMRYELVTQQIYQPDYSEFEDDYVEIDFVFGNKTFYQNCSPFLNATFIVAENSTEDNPVYILSEDDKYLVAEGSNTPSFDDNHYCALFKPHIELYYSDDGGETFLQADLREFSPLGQYRWRMRWYELGCSRNRCYRLICVSSAPIVVLGAVRNTRRVSGGAN
ncbi:hypothetical protein UFOVP685_13 [uncultured Caudovirales phage]|uniref:Bacteriophage P22, Gp10, DNA-stabilising n=1 Tax=uncultured Caudovirales phage TaxID=2100421 RepID=A0A6J5MY30_9CAUD|nr:hypothetical protein UFOVP590_10 [uncultured Caudovirales phage]CAB4157277.1 hypothetical protein UFOVP685_13 [uncultured Caudovirales phage]CAB5225504.1 hypothetical protein UFOVP750_39 [uncultured Caudovirales phage]